jgi:hypothetical protein
VLVAQNSFKFVSVEFPMLVVALNEGVTQKKNIRNSFMPIPEGVHVIIPTVVSLIPQCANVCGIEKHDRMNGLEAVTFRNYATVYIYE